MDAHVILSSCVSNPFTLPPSSSQSPPPHTVPHWRHGDVSDHQEWQEVCKRAIRKQRSGGSHQGPDCKVNQLIQLIHVLLSDTIWWCCVQLGACMCMLGQLLSWAGMEMRLVWMVVGMQKLDYPRHRLSLCLMIISSLFSWNLIWQSRELAMWERIHSE